MEDLALMSIHGDQVTHTSDYFHYLYEQCIRVLKEGKAYADDTEQQQATIPIILRNFGLVLILFFF